MCDIGKPLEIIDCEPFSLPAPLRQQREIWVEQTVTAKVAATETIVDLINVEL